MAFFEKVMRQGQHGPESSFKSSNWKLLGSMAFIQELNL
jgi:hypothetical protein